MRTLVICYILTLIALIIMMFMGASAGLKLATWIANLILFVTVFKEDLKFFF